ncbi:MAG: putative photosynthetic complex assembly protein PuhE [Pseudomonadota bacterium]
MANVSDLIPPILAAALSWWISTCAILWLVGRSGPARPQVAAGAGLIVVAATFGVVALRDVGGAAGPYAGFACGLVLWGWHEIMFLLGYVTGPRKTDCPQGLSAWRRFVVSTQTVIYHEVAIAVHAALLAALSWGADNAVAAWTFGLLWVMRLSAKAVVFAGAPNITDHFLPARLAYLKTYFNRNTAGRVLHAALALTVGVAGFLTYSALSLPHGSFDSTAYLLLATLAGLAVIEHVALALPLPDGALWSWALSEPRVRTERSAPTQWRNG